jgi:hypothetical protein
MCLANIEFFEGFVMTTIAVIGLGYVGLPLVVEFGKLGRTIGFDISVEKVQACQRGTDPARIERPADGRSRARQYSSEPQILAEADIIIVAVPTPVDQAHNPDFSPLIGASRTRGTIPEAGRDRRLRVDRVSGRHRGSVHSRAGRGFRPEVAAGFYVGYSPSASTRVTASTC